MISLNVYSLAALAALLADTTMAWSATHSGMGKRLSRAAAATPCSITELPHQDQVKTTDILSLDSIRCSLIRQEETIIFALIERAQFRSDSAVYDKHRKEDLSFLETMLTETEALHCKLRRYTSPEENAFFPELLSEDCHKDCLPGIESPDDLLSSVGGADQVNFNPELLQEYVDMIIPSITTPGDDEQHGSVVMCDITALQALSRRVHYGKFVAEAKYRSDPLEYQPLVDNGDADGVMNLLTNSKVEAQVLLRAQLKAATYGTEPTLLSSGHAMSHPFLGPDQSRALDQDRPQKVDPSVIESIYRDIIIPLTKDIEVAYLFRRCGREPPSKPS